MQSGICQRTAFSPIVRGSHCGAFMMKTSSSNNQTDMRRFGTVIFPPWKESEPSDLLTVTRVGELGSLIPLR